MIYIICHKFTGYSTGFESKTFWWEASALLQILKIRVYHTVSDVKTQMCDFGNEDALKSKS